MNERPDQVILRVRDGHLHRGWRSADGQLATAESCNLDDAASVEILPAIPDSAESADLCERCWPPRPSDIDPEVA